MLKKLFALCLSLMCHTIGFAQQTKSFVISGEVTKQQLITVDSLKNTRHIILIA